MRVWNLTLILAWVFLLSCGYIDNPNVADAESGSTSETGDGDPGDGDPGDGDPDDGDPGDGDPGDGDGDPSPPEAPMFELSLSQVKQFDFDWMPAVGADSYQLLESADTGEPFVPVGGDVMGLSTSLTVPLHFRLNASYKLAACNMGGCTESDAVAVEGALVEAIGYFKASNTDANDWFGYSVALSGDGNTLAVGARHEDSGATGIGGALNQADDTAAEAGAVYVFVRDDQNAWSQQAYVKASNTGANDYFGYSVALSGDGSTLAVGAYREQSSATGIGGNQVSNSADQAGAVYVFVRDVQDAWSQQAYVKASNSAALDFFGYSVALSGDGNTLAVGATGEDGSATGIGGNQADNAFLEAGAVYVFMRNGQNAWSQQAYVKASNPGADDKFGGRVALSSGDGSTLAVGSANEDSIGGNQADNSAINAGAVYVFIRNGQNAWSQQAYIKASNSAADDIFGTSVALSGDGSTLAVSAFHEDSSGGDQADNSAHDSGAAYVFVRDDQNAWSQQAYIKASNPGAEDQFGYCVALSIDGSTLAVGAYGEASSATGIGGNPADDSLTYAGAVYVFVRNGQDAWSQQAYVKATNSGASDQFGWSAALNGDGSTLAVGARLEDSSATGIGGNQANDSASDAGAVYLY